MPDSRSQGPQDHNGDDWDSGEFPSRRNGDGYRGGRSSDSAPGARPASRDQRASGDKRGGGRQDGRRSDRRDGSRREGGPRGGNRSERGGYGGGRAGGYGQRRDDRTNDRSNARRDDRREDRRGPGRGDRREDRGERPGGGRWQERGDVRGQGRGNDRGNDRSNDRRGGYRDDRRDNRRGDTAGSRAAGSGSREGGQRWQPRGQERDGGRPDSRNRWESGRRDERRTERFSRRDRPGGPGHGEDRRDNRRDDRREDRRDAGRDNRRDGFRGGAREERGASGRFRDDEQRKPRLVAPEVDGDVTGEELDRKTQHQIRSLESVNAEAVSKHLVMVGRYLYDDPSFALEHARYAVSRAGRVAAVREAAAVAAYENEEFHEALKEFRTYRRITGDDVHLPLMVDCERAMGKLDKALELATSEAAENLDTSAKVELAIVVAGIRRDQGDLEGSLKALEIPQLDRNRGFSYSPRLFRAYAEALRGVNRDREAQAWDRQAVVAEAALGLGQFSEPEIFDLVGEEPESEEGVELDTAENADEWKAVPSDEEPGQPSEQDEGEQPAGTEDGASDTETAAQQHTDERTAEDESPRD